jgi:cell wall-associated NlpC family hydrolase
LFRFLLIGTLAFAFSGVAFGVAPAAETPPAEAGTVAVATYESAAPTAGADLSMWGVGSSTEATAQPASVDAAAGTPAVRRFAGGIIARSRTIAVSLTRNAMRFLGVPYVFGGTSTGGFDCSGYVQHVFAMMGFHLPRTADAQFYAGRTIAGAMKPGDLVFFQTYLPGPSHVGIYLGNDEFVHASSSHGVTISSLHQAYWSVRYLGAKRYLI